MARSETILGRRKSRLAFREGQRTGEPFTVSAYRTGRGKLFYTDPCHFTCPPGPGVLYRVRIKPKRLP